MYLRAVSQSSSATPEAALAAATRAIEARPNASRAYPLRINANLALGRIDDALADYRTLATISPQDPTPLIDMALTLIRAFRHDEAGDALNEALGRDTRNVSAHSTIAMLAMMEGRNEDAIRHYRTVLTLDPDNGEAFLQLSRLADRADAEDLLSAATRAIARQAPKSHNLALLYFARGNLHRQNGAHGAETEDLMLANRIEAGLRPFDRKGASKAFQTLTTLTTAQAPERRDQPVPVFVVGLPRSGTTLLEQILTSHNAVFGCGELAMGNSLISAAEAGTLQFSAEAFADDYRAALPDMPADSTHFVDKLPANYKSLGLMNAAFPNARFILLQRDPRDVALSMWRNYFAQAGMNFTFNQKDMAFELNMFRRYATHWTNRLGSDLLSLDYEDIVADVEAASRRLAEFVGVSWQPMMAEPHRNTGSVHTVSATQVRDEVHRRSVEGWRKMAPALRTVISDLDADLWPRL